MYTLNITKAIRKVSVNDITEIIYENYYKRFIFSEEDSYSSSKRSKKKIIVVCEQINRKST